MGRDRCTSWKTTERCSTASRTEAKKPAGGPAGTLVFQSDRNGNAKIIFVMTRDGTTQTRVTGRGTFGETPDVVARRQLDRLHQPSGWE